MVLVNLWEDHLIFWAVEIVQNSFFSAAQQIAPKIGGGTEKTDFTFFLWIPESSQSISKIPKLILRDSFFRKWSQFIIFWRFEFAGIKPLAPFVRSFDEFQRCFRRYWIHWHPNGTHILSVDWVVRLIMMPRSWNSCRWLFYQHMFMVKDTAEKKLLVVFEQIEFRVRDRLAF